MQEREFNGSALFGEYEEPEHLASKPTERLLEYSELTHDLFYCFSGSLGMHWESLVLLEPSLPLLNRLNPLLLLRQVKILQEVIRRRTTFFVEFQFLLWILQLLVLLVELQVFPFQLLKMISIASVRSGRASCLRKEVSKMHLLLSKLL